MGAPYDCAIDIWSIGCTLYELYTGKILFPGRSNNHMLLLMMELKGRFNSKMIKRAKFGDKYFDDMGGFESIDRDKVTGTVSKLTLLCFGLLNNAFYVGRHPESDHLKAGKGSPSSSIAFCIQG